MRGSVRKRGASWTAIYDETRDEDGKRVQRWKGGFATKREAQQFLATTVSSLGDGSYVAPSKVTFGAYLNDWLEEIADDVRPLTFTKYRGVVRGHLKPRLGTVTLQGLKRAHFTGLYRQLRADGMAPATLAVVHAVAHRALGDAVEGDLLIRNPAAIRKAAPKADGPGGLSRRASVWSARELRLFLEHVAGDRLFACWRVIAMSGMRRGEALGLTWRAVDFEGGRLTVDQQLVPTRGGVTIAAPKTARSRRTVALDEETVDALRAHRETQLVERAFLGDGYVDRDIVFAREDGEPIHPQRLTEAFGLHVKAAELAPIRLHDLRHTHATLALTNGVPLHVVAARIGDDPRTLLKTYAHLLPTSDAEAAGRIAALV